MSEPQEPQDKGPLWNLVHMNPALWIGLIVASGAVLASFGLALTGEQKASIGGLLLAVVAIVQAVWTKANTTANKQVVVKAPDPVNQPTLVVPGEATTAASPGQIINAANSTPQ